MIWIQHRVNQAQALAKLPKNFGVEVDLRSDLSLAGSLHLSHDPWSRGEKFEDWAQAFRQSGLEGPIILNTKEDGLEARCLEILRDCELKNFFFLDTALPTLVKWTQKLGHPHFALRYSRYEGTALAQAFAGKADWLWVDCFDGMPVDAEAIKPLKKDFRICLVSPELQGLALAGSLSHFEKLAGYADAICTKSPSQWQEFLGR